VDNPSLLIPAKAHRAYFFSNGGPLINPYILLGERIIRMVLPTVNWRHQQNKLNFTKSGGQRSQLFLRRCGDEK
jgi:hypothetical protein